MQQQIYTLTDYQLGYLLSIFTSCRIDRIFFTDKGDFGVSYEKYGKMLTEYVPKQRKEKDNKDIILTTHDGVDIRLGDKYWLVYEDNLQIDKCEYATCLYVFTTTSVRYFSTRNLAQSYVFEKKQKMVPAELKSYAGLNLHSPYPSSHTQKEMPKSVVALSKGIQEIPTTFSKEDVDKMMENVFNAARETVHDVIFDTIHGKQPIPKYRSFSDYKSQTNA